MPLNDPKPTLIFGFDRPTQVGVLYLLMSVLMGLIVATTIARFFDEADPVVGVVALVGLGIVIGTLYLAYRSFTTEKQFLTDGTYLIAKNKHEKEGDRYPLKIIDHIVVRKEVRTMVSQLMIFSWSSDDKLWAVGVRTNDENRTKYWLFEGKRRHVQPIIDALVAGLGKEVRDEDDKDIQGIEVFL